MSQTTNGKQCNIALIYRLPSQSSDFDTFLTHSELLLDNIAN